ncbi:Uncharacterised protein [Yersinia frederiksenii]|uniref:Uncharacterized protein n=1 Tax=Yersinia frederiksenii TaxID=29484 RepID=A0AAI8ZVJ1_YERFR|nr:Uncharacterised protein [Yersinia frederiksenii]
MLGLEIGFVLDVTEAQCAGIQTVLALVCRAGNHCAIKLGVFAHGDIKAAFACEDTALLLHRVIIAVQLVATHAQVGRATGTNDRDTDTAADAGLLRIVVIAVLLALQQQVTADLRIDGFPADLRPLQ